MYFEYGETETEYLRSKDRKLAAVIDRIGHVYRTVDTDLFSAVIHHIIAQQISTKAQQTVWTRMQGKLGPVTPETVDAASVEELQSAGITFKKTEYIKEFAHKVVSGEFDLAAIAGMSDQQAIDRLSSLSGVGVWTAEMLLLFCLQRPNIFSFGDLAILRGMRMVYRHRRIDRASFEKYRRRLSPYCSVASLYFWAVAGGAIPGLTDPAPKVSAVSGAKPKRPADQKLRV